MGLSDRDTYVNSDTILDHVDCITLAVSKHSEIKNVVYIKTAVKEPQNHRML